MQRGYFLLDTQSLDTLSELLDRLDTLSEWLNTLEWLGTLTDRLGTLSDRLLPTRLLPDKPDNCYYC